MAEQVCWALDEILASAQWYSTGDSKLLSLVKRSVAAAERSVGLVLYEASKWDQWQEDFINNHTNTAQL